MATNDKAIVVVKGTKGAPITLQAEKLPDVRTILTDEQRKKARSMALAINLSDTRAIMDFGSGVSMADIAKEINKQAKVGDLRGTPSEMVLVDLGVIKQKFDPMRILSPKLQTGLFAARRFADAVKAYTQDWNNMQTMLDDVELRLERCKQDEGTSIDDMDRMRNDAMTLYENFTVLEAGYKYLIQRMISLYEEKQKALVVGDNRAEQELADLGDYIGMVDRSAFDTHFARARVIVVGTQIRLLRKANEEMYRMFSSQITTAMPLFRMNMAMAIKLVQDKKKLEVLQTFKDQDVEQAKNLQSALNDHLLAVATASEDGADAVQALLETYQGIAGLTDEIVKIHEDGAKARANLTGQINAVMVGMQKRVTKFDPKLQLEAPADLKDVPLKLEDEK